MQITFECKQQDGLSVQLGCHPHLQADTLSLPCSISSILERRWSNVAVV
jgi:hypothetical protein